MLFSALNGGTGEGAAVQGVGCRLLASFVNLSALQGSVKDTGASMRASLSLEHPIAGDPRWHILERWRKQGGGGVGVEKGCGVA